MLWHYDAEDRGTPADSVEIAKASRRGDMDGVSHISNFDGNRYVRYLNWDGTRWYRDYDWLENDWNGNKPSASLAS